MTADAIPWLNYSDACWRCGLKAAHYVKPYWRRHQHVCPTCCTELNNHFDRVGWPPTTEESP